MNKILGIFGLLIFVCVFTTVLSSDFDTARNLYNVTRWSSLFGIISIGVAFVIITGGIDLSTGSMLSLLGCILAMMVMDQEWSVPEAIGAVMAISLALGLLHGLLITKLKLQPFVVTLCGLLFYRGLARWYASDQPQGFGQAHNDGLRLLAIGKPWQPYGGEFDIATLLFYVGILLGLVSSLRSIWLWFKHDKQRLSASLIALGFAILLILTGVTHVASGDSMSAMDTDQDGKVDLAEWSAGFQASSAQSREDWARSFQNADLDNNGSLNWSERKAGTQFAMRTLGRTFVLSPANLMYFLGLVIFIPASIAFIRLGLRDNWPRVIVPTLCLFVAAIVFALVAQGLAPKFATISPGDTDTYRLGALSLGGDAMRSFIMVVVFVITGALMGSIGWLTSSAAGSSLGAQRILPVVIGSGVIWLMGMTKLPSTMVPMPLLILIGCAIVASIFLNQTIYGRYLLALGRNEEAARYSGINTDRMIILAYVICAGMAGLGAILFAVDINNLQPANHGNIYELYAIAAAVLGGCSLRGGEGTIVGVVVGAAVMRVLYNAINVLGIDTKLEWAIIGIVILTGVIADEVVKRVVAQRRAKLQAEQMD